LQEQPDTFVVHADVAGRSLREVAEMVERSQTDEVQRASVEL
jgi:hypothetical protein